MEEGRQQEGATKAAGQFGRGVVLLKGVRPATGRKGRIGLGWDPFSRVAPVVERLRSAGGTPYVVGGYVRDQLLGLGSKDLDIEVHGIDADKTARTLRQLGKVDEVGKSFGVLKITHAGEDLDISLPRTDSKTGTGHTGFDVSVDPHMGIEKALARRDFTINAIAMDPTTGEIIDPYGGARHLEERRLVAVSDAFSEDPLRVLRGVQFAGRFGMTMDEQTAALSRSLDKEVAELPLERVWGEFEKIGSKGKDFGAVATVIEQVGLQGRYGNIRPANPDLEGLSGDHRVSVALAAIGADPTRIGATNAVTRRIQEINAALEFRGTPAESRAFARTMKASTFADAQRVNPNLSFDPAVANGPTAPLISGKDLTALGMKPSPRIGEILREVTAAQDRGEVTTQEEAIRRAKEMGALTASSIVFACLSKACAPPPVGTGGSRGAALSAKSRELAQKKRGHASQNTSHYPVDTFKTTRANDKNPAAPGAGDLTAVRGHRGIHGDGPERRIPHQGETVDIYRDLGHGKAHKRGFPDDMAFSVRHASGMPGEQSGLVVASTTGVILNSGRPSWAHSAKAGAEVEGKRGVHGFIRGEVQEYVNPEKLSAMVKNSPEWVKITYYPGSQDFFNPKTRDRFVGSDQVALVNGEFFAKNPQYVSGPVPVSPIERKVMEAIKQKTGVTASAVWYEFACNDKACAPPPVGVGGSCGKGGCQAIVHRKVSKGIMGKGTESYKTKPGFCSAKDAGKGLCSRHEAAAAKREADTLAKRNHNIGKHSDAMVMQMANAAPLNEIAVAEARKRKLIEKDHPVIGSEGIRGDSKPVSYEEFQRLARNGQWILDGLQSRSAPIKGLDDNWDAIKSNTHAEALKEWGGATIDAHTGEAVAQGANRWALTIKDKGFDTVSIPQGASKEEFDAAMETAKERFRPILEREGSHLGVFHDDDLGRIDIDPVLVVDRLEDVHTIGAATRAIGGAYNFADGNGYWPPHVAD
jgi:hypothetical protein